MARLINRIGDIVKAKQAEAKEAGSRLTQKEIADAADIEEGTLSRYINDKTDSFHRDVLERLCIYFNVDVSELLYIERDENDD